MTTIFILFRRQLAAYFRSPTGFAILAVFLAVAGLNFCRTLAWSREEPLGLGDLLFGSVFFWAAVVVTIALITMQTLAGEKRSGTLEALLTAPVTDLQVVAAKYGAALAFFAILCAPMALYPAVLRLFSTGLEELDPVPVATGYSLLLLSGGFFIAIGVFTSALARSPAVAALLCLAGVSLFFFEGAFPALGGGLPEDGGFAYLSSVRHMADFSQGVVDTRPVAMYVSGIALFLFAAVKTIEARQWK